jgi:RNA 2',3'-cyclic 3'-phosphodiesterase
MRQPSKEIGAPATLRSFVAVPLPGTTQADIFAVAQALASDLPAVKWSRKVENLHVTIKFLGPVAETRLGELGSALSRAVADLPHFGIDLRGMGAFPSPGKAHVIWAGVEDRIGGLERLAQAVEGVAAELGVGEKESRPFNAHVTVGRSKEGVDARVALARFTDRTFGSVAVDEIHLYESQLGGGPSHAGSTYILRHRAALGSGNGNGSPETAPIPPATSSGGQSPPPLTRN